MMKTIALTFLLLCGTSFAALDENSEVSPRLMVHLLDYLGLDYPGAVKDGKVINKLEYDEMTEFAVTLLQLYEKLPETHGIPNLNADLKEIQTLIKKKASEQKIAKLSQDVKWKVIGVSGIQLAPNLWPNHDRGKKLFGENCAKCHGANGRGDGPEAAQHDPRPSDFHELEKMSNITSFQAFNAIRLGVTGTAMAAWPTFSDSEIWDLAFYVNSLRFEGQKVADSKAKPTVSLQQVATLSDVQLKEVLKGTDAEKGAQLASLRQYSSQGDESQAFIEVARTNLNDAGQLYRAQNFDGAKQKALMAYLNGVEPIEPRVRANDPALLVEIEERMGAVRFGIEKRVGAEEVDHRIALALDTVNKVEGSLGRQTSPGMTFSISAGIVLREAFEAIFLLIALLGVIRSVGSARAAFFVHLGWISAVGTGVLLWFFSGWVMRMSGAGREMLEGIVSLIAVVVVLYMGFWLHRKTEMGRWREFLNSMAKTVVSGKSLMLLAGISFMAVFREAFETVLFLRAVLLESGGTHQNAMVAGVLTAFFSVVILTIALVKFSAKLPIRKLFDISAMVMIVLAFVLMGKAVHSFQEVGYLSVTEFPIRLRLDLFGLYPSYETIIPQLIILALSVAFWLGNKKPTVTAPA